MTNLKENREENDRDCSSNKERLSRNALRIDEEYQCEGDGSTQSTVRHDEFFHTIQLMKSEIVGKLRQNNYTCKK